MFSFPIAAEGERVPSPFHKGQFKIMYTKATIDPTSSLSLTTLSLCLPLPLSLPPLYDQCCASSPKEQNVSVVEV